MIHKLNYEILKDDQVRNEPIYMKMDRKRIVNEEIRHHRGKSTNVLSPTGSKKQDEEKYPWEVREEIKQYEIKRMVAGKPGHQNRKETLLTLTKKWFERATQLIHNNAKENISSSEIKKQIRELQCSLPYGMFSKVKRSQGTIKSKFNYNSFYVLWNGL